MEFLFGTEEVVQIWHVDEVKQIFLLREKKKVKQISPSFMHGVNFINIKRTNFLYEYHFGSFYYVHVTALKAAETTFVWKIRTFNVDEIDTWPLAIFPLYRKIMEKMLLLEIRKMNIS